MAAFVDLADAAENIPVAVYCVVADENASQVIDVLAVFVETLKEEEHCRMKIQQMGRSACRIF